ncbi:microtubule-associated protein 4 [Patella vulgata]|uniref:microtubule-associated protein 4 n=1 Tax=Patella vulgata TaxID=6465 RepID=UPI0024A96C7C|nr:microtubule-associated protein 4 [Patella vulgata]
MEAETKAEFKTESGHKRYRPNIAKGGMRFAPIRRVEYVPAVKTPESNIPYLSVKQRQDGQFVVIEKFPTSYRNRSVGKVTSVQASLANSGVKFRTIRPRWRYAKNGDFLGNTENLNLPTIDLGWKKESKCGSLDYYHHAPGGGVKRIFSESVRWKAKSKVGSLDNVSYGKYRCRSYPSYEHYGLRLPDVSPRYEAMGQTDAKPKFHYTPGRDQEMDKSPRNARQQQAQSHIHSLDNIRHQAQGGNVILPRYKKARKEPVESAVGSFDLIHHKAGGGDFKLPQIPKLKINVQSKIGSLDNIDHEPNKQRAKIPHYAPNWKSRSKIGSLDNVQHVAGGGGVKITNKPVKWKVRSKVDSRAPPRIIYEREESDYSMDSL